MNKRTATGVVLVILAFLATPSWGGTAQEHLVRILRGATLDLQHAVVVDQRTIRVGQAELHLEHGALIPTVPLSGRVVEMVFVGRGTISLQPPDRIEAAQLELFTGKPALRETFSQAILIVGVNQMSRQLLAGEPLAQAAVPPRAREIYADWIASTERRTLALESAIWRNLAGDPSYAEFFGAQVRGDELGSFLYLVDPDAQEQVRLMQFVPIEAAKQERRRLERYISKERRQGRHVGLRLEDIGYWDNWVSTSLLDPEGREVLGSAGFEPRHYGLAIQLANRTLALRAIARIELEAVSGGRRFVTATLHPDLKVDKISDGHDAPLFFIQSGGQLLVDLASAPAAGESSMIQIRYHGRIVEKVDKGVFTLRSTIDWYPRVGDLDRATYDVDLQWPDRLDLLASGKRTSSGYRDGQRWERRQLTVPSRWFCFEVGEFERVSLDAGHIRIELAFDAGSRRLPKGTRTEIAQATRDALLYFEEAYGPYPLDELTVVTVPRAYSQGMLGFVSLATMAMADTASAETHGSFEDRRTVIAHEIAHQWWGNLVGWRGYRDKWLSEGLANYSALDFARRKLDWKGRERITPTSGWQRELASLTEDGRTVESMGPLVLGARLASSRGADAYQAVIYSKGTLVLDMLARRLGEENFRMLLRELVRMAGNQPITTEQFLGLATRFTGTDVRKFAEQFIYGTGFPEFHYSYQIAKTGEATWRVSGVATQVAPARFRHRLRESLDGRFSVEEVRVSELMPEAELVVPVQVSVFDPTRAAPEIGRDGNAEARGVIEILGMETPFAIELEWEPRRLVLDPDGEVLARFYSEEHEARAVLISRAHQSLAEGALEGAERFFQAALETRLPQGAEASDEQWLTAQIHLGQARVHLLLGKEKEVEEDLRAARKTLGHSRWRWIDDEVNMLEAHLEVRRGQFEHAFKRLRSVMLSRQTVETAEGFLLLAIAARETNHAAELEIALDEAGRRGADVSALR